MDRPAGHDGLSRLDVLGVVSVVIFVVWGVAGVLAPTWERERRHATRARCAESLSAMGKAMLAYAGDYNGAFPVAGGRGSSWGAGLRDWSGKDRSAAFGLDPNGTGGGATISSSLYLLVRCQYVNPEKFLCPVDKGAKLFHPVLYGLRDKGLADLWDFGPDPARHCSYAYQMVYSPYELTTSFEGFEGVCAIAADRNPWLDSPRAKAQDFSKFRPDIASHGGTNDQACCGNSVSHKQEGQDVLYVDGHVQFQARPYASIEDDNIYTISGGPGSDPWGTPPRLGSQPANRKDSLLVNDPPALREQR